MSRDIYPTLSKKQMKSQKLMRFELLPTFKKCFRAVSIPVLIHHRLQLIHMIQHCFIRCQIIYTKRDFFVKLWKGWIDLSSLASQAALSVIEIRHPT